MSIRTKFVALAGAKEITKLGRTKLYELLSRGDIVAIKAGRRLLFDTASLHAWLASCPRAVIRHTPRRATRAPSVAA